MSEMIYLPDMNIKDIWYFVFLWGPNPRWLWETNPTDRCKDVETLVDVALKQEQTKQHLCEWPDRFFSKSSENKGEN